MIVVVEGPSAAGKTTWCAAHGLQNAVPENGRIEPPAGVSDDRVARFWDDANCRRWSEAVRVEAELGLAICDTDPLKLHYHYCLARIGVASWEHFDAGVALAAEAIATRRLGIADMVLVNIPDDDTLARQRAADPTRRRRNFALHLRLGPGLRDWYGALARLDPGRVRWGYPITMPAPAARDRYDTELFRAWIAELPGRVIGV